MIEIVPAIPVDAGALTETSIRAFHDDALRFGGVVEGGELFGPPGYDSLEWHLQMMRRGRFFVIREGERVVGGMVAFPAAGVCNLGRIWLEPEAQGRGIGRHAIEWIHAAFPSIRKWTLDTPAFAARNHHLYESLGYRKVGEETVGDGLRLFLYERETV